MIPYAEDGRTLISIAPDDRDWVLYVIFGLVGLETNPEEAEDRAEFIDRWDHHVDWLAGRFASPDAMLGSEGVDFCEIGGLTIPSPVLAEKWRHFKTAHAADTLADIDTLLATLLFDAEQEHGRPGYTRRYPVPVRCARPTSADPYPVEAYYQRLLCEEVPVGGE